MSKLNSIVSKPRGRFQYQPFLFSIACIAFLGFLVNSFYSQNQETKQEAVESDVESAASSIYGRVKSHSEFASLIADEYGENQLQKKFFIRKSSRFNKNHPELTSISIINKSGERNWVYPESVNHLRSMEVSRDPIHDVVEKALKTENMAISVPFSCLKGSVAIALAVPIIKDLAVAGSVVVQIDFEKLFRSDLRSEYSQRYRIELKNAEGISLVNIFVPDKALTEIFAVKSLFDTKDSPTIGLVRYQSPYNWLIVSLSVVCFFLVLGLTLVINTLSNDNKKRKLIQLELERAKNAAEQANKAKSQLIANISHEIRTPLGAIQGYTDLLERFSFSKEEKRKTIKSIKRNTFHLLNIIRDLLDLSKIEAGLLEFEEIDFHLLETIQDTVETVKLYSQKPDIIIEIDLLTPVPETVTSDQAKFRQILTNLISNAVKFSNEGGIKLSLSFDDQVVVIKVIDKGIGMTNEQAMRIFRPFVQGDTSIARKFGGTGLGLALSKTFAQKLGGELHLTETKLKQGSTFTFTFTPKLGENPVFINSLKGLSLDENETIQDRKYPDLLGRKILVVEDCKDNQIIYTKFLEDAGAQVSIANSGAEAIEKASSGITIDFIIMDIQMPELDGYEATRMLRSQGVKIPILALTAHAMKGERERCLEAGCDDYITKPIDSESLIESIAVLGKAENVENGENKPEPLHSKMHADPRVKPLLSGFLTGINGRIKDMRAATAEGNHKLIAILSHQLKGTALNYGYPTISEAAAEIEIMAHLESEDNKREVLSVLEKIESQANEALACL